MYYMVRTMAAWFVVGSINEFGQVPRRDEQVSLP